MTISRIPPDTPSNIWDTNKSNYLTIAWNEDDSAERVLNILVHGATRSLDLNESLTIGDGEDGTITFSGASKTLTIADDATISATPGLIKAGTYTGDNSTGQGITGIGFAPKYVKIWVHPGSESTTYIYEKLDQTWGDYCMLHSAVATDEHYVYDSKINSLDADGFTVDDDAGNGHPNAGGVTYDYLALG